MFVYRTAISRRGEVLIRRWKDTVLSGAHPLCHCAVKLRGRFEFLQDGLYMNYDEAKRESNLASWFGVRLLYDICS